MLKSSLKLLILKPEMITHEYISWLNSPSNQRFTDLRMNKEPFQRETVTLYLDQRVRNREYLWGLFSDDRHVGNIGFSGINRYDGFANISYLIGNGHEGQGFASRGVAAAVEFLFSKSLFNIVYCPVVDVNVASVRVAEKVGFHPEAHFRHKHRLPEGGRSDVTIFSAHRSEWKNSLPGISIEDPKWDEE